MQHCECFGGERIASRPRDDEAVVYQCRQFVPRQRKKVIARGYTLRQLPELRRFEHLQQLRLAQQDHLQQLARVGLEIGEKADLLQDVERKVLCFIDHQNDALLARVRFDEMAIDAVDELLDRVLLRLGRCISELLADRREQFRNRYSRVDHEGDVGVVGNPFEQASAERRLARSDFPREQHEAAGPKSPLEMRKRFAVPLAHVQEVRVGRDREG